jgi:hypothetical protein
MLVQLLAQQPVRGFQRDDTRSVRLGWGIALLEILPLRERPHVPGAAICSRSKARRHSAWQIRVGLIGFGGIVLAIVAAAYESTAAAQNQFLMYPIAP